MQELACVDKDSSAMFYMSLIYEGKSEWEGIVEENYKLALEWLYKAAENGSTTARANLGIKYSSYGDFVHDAAKEQQWLEISFE